MREWVSFFQSLSAVVLYVVAALCPFGLAWGNSLYPFPEDQVLLKVTGNVGHTLEDSRSEYTFTIKDLEALKSHSFVTSNPWTESPTKYTGVTIRALLKAVGAGSTNFRAKATDDYFYTFESFDFETCPIIIAYKVDDQFLDLRSLGPLWVMFPFDDYPELLTESNKAAAVWQLIEIDVF